MNKKIPTDDLHVPLKIETSRKKVELLEPLILNIADKYNAEINVFKKIEPHQDELRLSINTINPQARRALYNILDQLKIDVLLQESKKKKQIH